MRISIKVTPIQSSPPIKTTDDLPAPPIREIVLTQSFESIRMISDIYAKEDVGRPRAGAIRFSLCHPFDLWKRNIKMGERPATNAYLKCWEMLEWLNPYLGPSIKHMDLASFPGAFILTVQDFCKLYDKKFEWRAQALLPELTESVVLGDTFGLYASFPERFHPGDLTDEAHVASLPTGFNLVTGDVGIPDSEETLVDGVWLKETGHLDVQFGQACAALHCLSKGGCTILKMFSLITRGSLYLIDQLAERFEDFYLVKPHASRVMNQESYIIGINHKPHKEPLSRSPPDGYIFRCIEDISFFETIKVGCALRMYNLSTDIIREREHKIFLSLFRNLLESERDKLVVFFTDGSARSNSSNSKAGAAFHCPELTIRESRSLIGTNNIAELTAIEMALTSAKEHRVRPLIVSDSEYAIKAITGVNAVKANKDLIERCITLAKASKAEFRHQKAHRTITRDMSEEECRFVAGNVLADKLATEASSAI